MTITTATAAAATPYKKIIWRLIPFLMFCYVLAQVDRFNIGFAKLQFLRDLNLNDAVFGLAASAFYVGYMLFEVPANWLLARIGVRRMLLSIMLFWGAVTCALMFASSAAHLYALRFLLGVAQAGFFPGMLFYLTLWFPDRLRGRVSSLFIAAIPVAGIVGGPLAGWIMQRMDSVYGLRGWQWLFLLEGLPTMLVGVIAYLYLSDGPARANWLSPQERKSVTEDLAADHSQRNSAEARDFGAAFRHPLVWRLALIYFAYFFALNANLLWSPTLLKSVGEQSVGTVGMASGIIATVATLAMLLIGRSSDRRLERRWHVSLAGILAGAALLMLPLAANTLVGTIALLMLSSAGLFSVLALFWTIPSSFLHGSAAAAGIALISSFGALAGSLGPALIGWIKVQTGSLYVGVSAAAILLIISMLSLNHMMRPPEPALNSPRS